LNFNPLYGLRRALVALLLWLLALAPAMAISVVYEGVTSQLNVNAIPGHTYTWEIYTDAIVDFAVVPGNCPLTSYEFTAGNTGASISVKWLKPGIYFYKVTARDAALCAMNFKVGMLKVLSAEALSVIKGATLSGACQRVLLDASNSIGDNLQYEWTTADPGIELTQPTGVKTEFLLSSSYSGTLPATFLVNLKVTDVRLKTHSSSISIKVERLPVAEISSTRKYETDGTILADGKRSTGTAPNYNWYTTPGGDIVGPDNQQAAKLYGSGTYTLKVTDLYNCLSYTNLTLTFNQIIAVRDHARFSWAQNAIIPVLDNDNLPADYVVGPVQITQLPAMGDVVPNADGTITYTPRNKVSGHDQFEYKVCDAVGNCSSAMVNIDIFDSPVSITEGFSPNGDGINDLLEFKGLDEYSNSQLTIYTRTGVLVYKSGSNGYDNKWDGTATNSGGTILERVPSGTYYYILKLGGTNRTLKQFIYIAY